MKKQHIRMNMKQMKRAEKKILKNPYKSKKKIKIRIKVKKGKRL
jgi:hypothetical protein